MAKKNGSGDEEERGPGRSEGAQVVGDATAGPVAAEHWSEEPEEHDYPAAAAYLSLICDPTEVRRLVAALKRRPSCTTRPRICCGPRAWRCCRSDNAHVAADLAKVGRGEPLSPVLLVRGDFRRGVPLTIADGYHRVCASYHLDENADIPCHLVDHKGPTAVPGSAGLGRAPVDRTGRGLADGAGAWPSHVRGHRVAVQLA